ncbi:diguanylate cyclase domain-containing protein [Microbacterium sp. USHLN186]|uniref:diguanylate cyclase domain-containing protein n=1 Tax=Microbacterium sp. USHLN186 TaxID=3081286 RepID=UPI00301748ED
MSASYENRPEGNDAHGPDPDRLVDLLQHTPAALFVLGLDGTILAHNEGMRVWLGESDDAAGLRGRNIVEWLTASSRLLYETQVMPRLLETGRLREVMLEIRDSDRERRAALINAQLRRTEDGGKVAYIAAVETTARAAFEKQLVSAQRAADIAHRRLVLLQDATSALAVANGLDDLGETLGRAASRATAAAWTAVRLVDPSGRADVTVREWGISPPGVELDARPAASDQQLVCRDADEIAQVVPQDAAALRMAGIEALVVTPITRLVDDRTVVLGEIHCWFRRARSLESDELETLLALAAQAERVVDHLRLRDRLRHHALHDSLTGLPNRTLFEERLERMLARAAESGEACTVLFLDLDGFKGINDQRGHGVGDEVLRTIATRLTAVCRVSDTVARLGGDEFLIAAARLDEQTALQLAERVRAAVRRPLEGAAAGSPLSASVGAVHWMPARGDAAPAAADVVAAADAAMYEAKHAGKDGVRVRVWGG